MLQGESRRNGNIIEGEQKCGTDGTATDYLWDPWPQVVRIVEKDTRTEESVKNETEPECTVSLCNDGANTEEPTNNFSLAWTSSNYCEHKTLLHSFAEENSSWTNLGLCCVWRAICSLWGHVLSQTQILFLSFVFHFLHFAIQSKHADLTVTFKFLLLSNTISNS